MTPDQWEEMRRQAAADHQPGLEPYASMTPDEIMAYMDAACEAGDFTYQLMLEQHLRDKMTPEMHELEARANRIADSLALGTPVEELDDAPEIIDTAYRLARRAGADA
jgi:hypothetical protein